MKHVATLAAALALSIAAITQGYAQSGMKSMDMKDMPKGMDMQAMDMKGMEAGKKAQGDAGW